MKAINCQLFQFCAQRILDMAASHCLPLCFVKKKLNRVQKIFTRSPQACKYRPVVCLCLVSLTYCPVILLFQYGFHVTSNDDVCFDFEKILSRVRQARKCGHLVEIGLKGRKYTSDLRGNRTKTDYSK